MTSSGVKTTLRVVKDSGASGRASKAEVEVLYEVQPDDVCTAPEDDNKKLFSLPADYKLIFFGTVGLSSNFTCSIHLFHLLVLKLMKIPCHMSEKSVHLSSRKTSSNRNPC